MGLKINTIITLDNGDKYVVLNETIYENNKYFMVMGIDENKEVISTKAAILEEMVDGEETYVKKVEDSKLLTELTKILKEQI